MLLRKVALGLALLTTPILRAEETVPLIPGVAGGATQKSNRGEQCRLLEQKRAEMDRLQREIMKLRTATDTPQQLLVKVQMIEVSLTKMRNLGIDTEWFANAAVGGPQIRELLDEIRDRDDSSLVQPKTDAELNDHLLFVDWLRQNTLAKVLAEPTVVAVSGRPASFHAGGQFPLPANEEADSAVEFKSYGTDLNIHAVTLGNNQLRLGIDLKVSEIDDDRSIEINGVRIPGLNVRQCKTAVEMSFGQTAVMTGLVEKRTEVHQDDSGETEETLVDVGLMVTVTPELIAPIETAKDGDTAK